MHPSHEKVKALHGEEVDAAVIIHIHDSLWNHKFFRSLPPKLELPPGFGDSVYRLLFGCEHG